MNTPYTARLWEDAAAFHTRRRQLMQAYVFVHLHHRTPELEAALRTVGQQLAFLDPPVVQKALADMLDRMRKAADQLLETAPADEYQDLIQFELRQRLAALQRRELTEVQIATAIEDFGEQHFLAAQAAVEDCLAQGQSSEIRAQALITLVECWQLPEYRQLLPTFLDDPDSFVRFRAMRLVGQDRQGSRDEVILRKLAAVALSEEQAPIDRLAAYEAMQAIAGIPYDEQGEELSHYLEACDDFASAPGVDWSLIERYR